MVSQLDALFHEVLKHLQHQHPNILHSDIKEEEEYSIQQSLRCGTTTEAQNWKIPQLVIEINNQWKKDTRSRGVLPSMSMIEWYSNAKASVEAEIKFSKLM
ncbi:hypothetical protein ACA910_014753 [Epithemia clementina (nom. ined.)]